MLSRAGELKSAWTMWWAVLWLAACSSPAPFSLWWAVCRSRPRSRSFSLDHAVGCPSCTDHVSQSGYAQFSLDHALGCPVANRSRTREG